MCDSGKNIFRPILDFFDRSFDRFYGSKYNPLYQSGTLAVNLLALTIGTGIYLLFWYSLSSPFESMVTIENQWLWARWVRNLHRYASDLSVVVVVFHVFRMFTEGKTWGPRLLAWMTGTILALVMFVVGWTGFVLVWDSHAHALVAVGAEMLGWIPFLADAISRSVSGATPIGSSFFFMNLFLHMSLPLMMVALLWLHTSKLNKPAWLPQRRIFYALTAALVILSVVKSPPLEGPADLLVLDRKYFLNVFYGFVIPLVQALGSTASLLVMFAAFLLVLFVPLYWRPTESKRAPVAKHNPMACTGCGQCASDCPFDAIDMVARTEGTGSEQVAFVDVTSCVGCGICSASCSQLAIGPEDKSSRLQLHKIKELKAHAAAGSTLVIHCQQNSLGRKFLDKNPGTYAAFPIDCTGNLHVASAHFALGHFGKLQIIGCAKNACVNRLGQERLEQRFLENRPPEAPARMDFSKVQIFSGSPSDLDAFAAQVSGAPPKQSTWFQKLKMTLATFVILSAVAGLSSYRIERSVDFSALRVAIRLPVQASETCREKSAEELSKLPMHMRKTQECTRTVLDYRLRIVVDGEVLVEKTLSASGVRSDKPILFEGDLRVAPGRHELDVELVPMNQAAQGVVRASEKFVEEFAVGRALLLSFNPAAKSLFVSHKALK